MTTKFTKMAYDKADDMLFGHAKNMPALCAHSACAW